MQLFFTEHLIKFQSSNKNNYAIQLLPYKTFISSHLNPALLCVFAYCPWCPHPSSGMHFGHHTEGLLMAALQPTLLLLPPKICFRLALRYRSTKELRFLTEIHAALAGGRIFSRFTSKFVLQDWNIFFLDLIQKSMDRVILILLILFIKRLQVKFITPYWICRL